MEIGMVNGRESSRSVPVRINGWFFKQHSNPYLISLILIFKLNALFCALKKWWYFFSCVSIPATCQTLDVCLVTSSRQTSESPLLLNKDIPYSYLTGFIGSTTALRNYHIGWWMQKIQFCSQAHSSKIVFTPRKIWLICAEKKS